VLFGRAAWFSGGLGGIGGSDGLSGLGVHARGVARGASRLHKQGAEALGAASPFLGVSLSPGVAAAPALPLDLPLPLGCTFSLPAAAAYMAAARQGSVVWGATPDASLVPVFSFLPTPAVIVTLPLPFSPVEFTPSRRRRARAPPSAKPPPPPACRQGVPDGARARLQVLPAGGKVGGGGEEHGFVDIVAERTGRPMGGRKRTYTEAMLAADTAALEDAKRDGFNRPELDAIVGSRAHRISAASHCTSAAFFTPSHFRKLRTTGLQMSSYVSPDAWVLCKAMSSV